MLPIATQDYEVVPESDRVQFVPLPGQATDYVAPDEGKKIFRLPSDMVRADMPAPLRPALVFPWLSSLMGSLA